MMKKRILSLIIVAFLLIPCFALNISATSVPSEQIAPTNIVISDDYQTLVYNNTTYVRFDSSITCWEVATRTTDNNCSYLENAKFIDYEISPNDCIVSVSISYNDGSSFNCNFINEQYLTEHGQLLNHTDVYTIDFDDGKKTLSKSDLSKESTPIDYSDIEYEYYNTYDVCVYNSNESFYIEKGALVFLDGSYYYIDYKLNNIENIYSHYRSTLTAHKVNNPDLISEFNKITGNGQTDIIDLLFSGELFTGFGTLLLCVIFAVIPLATFVLFLILSIRAKTPIYKKLFRAIYIVSILEILIFILSVVLIIIFG